MYRTNARTLCSLLLLAPVSFAQEELLQIAVGGGGGDIANVGDVNGDGVDDLGWGATASVPGMGGKAQIYSGVDGTLLHEVLGVPAEWQSGGGHGGLGRAICGVGDMNGDGLSDYAMGCPGHTIGTTMTRAIHIHSGLDGAEIRSFYGIGSRVQVAGDVNGDGVMDLFASQGFAPQGFVSVVSGVDGSLLHFYGSSSEWVSKAGLGDLNQDGFDDFGISHPTDPTVIVYSGFDGSVLHQLMGTVGSQFARQIGPAGDVDVDGAPDFFVTEPEGALGLGSVHIYSGQSGLVLRSYAGSTVGDDFGRAAGAVGDIDQDGVEDLAIGSPVTGGQGRYEVFSGANGMMLAQVTGTGPSPLGYWLHPMSDINGDGMPEVLAPTERFPIDNGYLIRVYAGWNPFKNTFCDGLAVGGNCPCGNGVSGIGGCANSTGSGAQIGGSGSASVSLNNMVIDCSGLPSTVPCLLFAGNSMANAGAGLPFGDGLRCAGGGIQRLGVTTSDSGGSVNWGSGIAGTGAWGPGDTRFIQGWYRDQAGACSMGFNTSNAMKLTMTP